MLRSFSLLMLLLGASSALGCATAPASRQVIIAPNAPAPVGAYSQAVLVGDTLYVAGQIALEPHAGQMIADSSIEAHTRQALENLRSVLSSAGMSLDDVVMTQIFVSDIEEVRRMNAVYATYFRERPPARAVVEVARLPRGSKLEIAAIAARSH